MIKVLDQETINQIAAGEVVERPSSVVKEIVENAIDACATAITVEIKEGGLSFIRVTDNGCGICKKEISTAFLRHATSKLRTADDLLSIASLGFRGEALASIAAVAQVEMITKTKGTLTGIRYEIHGGEEIAMEEIGCPEGTTLLIRNLFYNTPARKKFLKTAMTEGSYIQELVMRLAMSKPHIAMQLIVNGQSKLSTTGNGKLKDVIYQIYGRDVTANLIEIDAMDAHMKITGYIGKPFVNKGNRSFENYFVNGRFMKNSVITKAIEEAYKTFVMVHKFPFTALSIELEPSLLDINVHPTKMEMRYGESDKLYHFVYKVVRDALLQKELIPTVTPDTAKETAAKRVAEIKENLAKPRIEPFEKTRIEQVKKVVEQPKQIVAEVSTPKPVMQPVPKPVEPSVPLKHEPPMQEKVKIPVSEVAEEPVRYEAPVPKKEVYEQETLLLTEEAKPKHRLIGQLFKTYCLIEYENQLFIMDQHAAHEKVMYERLMKKFHNSEIFSQQLMPPMVVTLSPAEADALDRNLNTFEIMGFAVEPFGGNEYVIRAVPEDIFGVPAKEVFTALIASLSDDSGAVTEELFVTKLSTMACKAAIKGNHSLTDREITALVDELMTLENPYNCPHGRPTIIKMSQTEIEKKFKRIQD